METVAKLLYFQNKQIIAFKNVLKCQKPLNPTSMMKGKTE